MVTLEDVIKISPPRKLSSSYLSGLFFGRSIVLETEATADPL